MIINMSGMQAMIAMSTVMLKFKDRDEAKRWYNSPEYQAIINLRLQSVDGRAVLCDAFEPPN